MSENTADLPIKSDINLAPYNTLHIRSKAKSFISIKSIEQLKQLLHSWGDDPPRYFILGGGSNVLFVDDFDGLVIHVDMTGRTVVREDEDHLWLALGSGENWHDTVMYCVEQGWGGIENLALIPGTVGAAPIQNIGAYGVELKDVFESLRAVELETGEERIFSREECSFGYRDSVFKNKLKGRYLVAEVTLKLSKDPEANTSYGSIRKGLEERGIEDPGIGDVCDMVIDIRNSKLPSPEDLGNAGSFFKNPVVSRQKYEQLKRDYPTVPGYELNDIEIKVPAGWLIEQTGWKGRVVGNAGTYKQQALVIVNHGGATGEEILQLANRIKESVKQQFGIELIPEVNIVR